ncbi:unnamed protein product [Arabidopsis thaliana]|uniref:F-box domain-containing protein n=1 Tax=Arabidopsis thaliana TaxID=3702 RepID=A0A178V5A1_ARATH|nr:hypothetical protein AXX17_AT3G18620 [Arabidopsis thaliana]VYS57708.1 unnamed protein product [Arabidopsis thaliana]
MMSDLPRDLLEERLSRVPVKSLREARFTCKNWKTLSKKRSFTKKHLAQEATSRESEFKVVMVLHCKVYLTSINLRGIHNGFDPSINRQAKLVSLNGTDLIDISEVYHCDGYEKRKSNLRYKVLRFVDFAEEEFVEYEIYELKSNSWRVLDVTSDWEVEFYARGVSLKGNTYWFATDKFPEISTNLIHSVYFLLCFNFTSERFGPRLPLPFYPMDVDTVSLSSVREEQLAVLFQRKDNLHMEIWVTTNIEPEEVMWSKLFLAVDMQPLTDFKFGIADASFIIDEEKKVVVVFAKDKDVMYPTRNTAYIIGEDGYYKEVDLGKTTDKIRDPLVCSYVPSSAQIKQGGKRKKKGKLITD